MALLRRHTRGPAQLMEYSNILVSRLSYTSRSQGLPVHVQESDLLWKNAAAGSHRPSGAYTLGRSFKREGSWTGCMHSLESGLLRQQRTATFSPLRRCKLRMA